MKIVAMTVCCMDEYVEQNITCVGGNSLNFATQCIKSGIKNVSVVGGIGNDTYGKEVKKHLQNYSINNEHVYLCEGETATNKIYIAEDGDRYFIENSWNGGVYESFILSTNDWEFVKEHDIIATTAFNPNIIDVLKCKMKKQMLVVDFLDTHDFDYVEQLIDKIDIVFISGNQNTIDRLKPLSKTKNVLIVVTLGKDGSVVLSDGNSYIKKALEVDNVIDTTGCGDAYQASFVISWYQNHNIDLAMTHGAIAASKILSHYGGV